MAISPKGFDYWEFPGTLFVILFSANLIDHHSVIASFQRLMASMKEKANETSKAPTLSVESVIKSYLTSKLSNNNLTFWAKYSEEGKDCRIKMALLNLAKRYLTPHPTSTKVERLFSTASNVLDGRNLNSKSLV